jgi:hypothetical protein
MNNFSFEELDVEWENLKYSNIRSLNWMKRINNYLI